MVDFELTRKEDEEVGSYSAFLHILELFFVSVAITITMKVTKQPRIRFYGIQEHERAIQSDRCETIVAEIDH